MMMAVMKLSALANFCQMCEGQQQGQGRGWRSRVLHEQLYYLHNCLNQSSCSQLEFVDEALVAEQGSHCWRRHLVACGVTHSVAIKQLPLPPLPLPLPLPQRIFSHSKRFSFVSHFVSFFFRSPTFLFQINWVVREAICAGSSQLEVPASSRLLLRFFYTFFPCACFCLCCFLFSFLFFALPSVELFAHFRFC